MAKAFYFFQVRANAVRALGNLARFIEFDGGNNDATRLNLYDVGSLNKQGEDLKGIPDMYSWLERVVQTLVSCVTTGNVKVSFLNHDQILVLTSLHNFLMMMLYLFCKKVQWNVCHALGNLFLNKSIKLSEMSWYNCCP